MSPVRRRMDAIDQAIDIHERVRKLELGGAPVAFGPKPWSPTYGAVEVLAELLMCLGAWVPTDREPGRQAQWLRAQLWANGFGIHAGEAAFEDPGSFVPDFPEDERPPDSVILGRIAARELTRALQMVGAMPSQRRFQRISHSPEVRGVRIGGPSNLTWPVEYNAWADSDDARYATFSPPYPLDYWQWFDEGVTLPGTSPGDGAAAPGGNPIPRVYADTEAPWEDQPDPDRWAVEPGVYVLFADNASLFLADWGSAAFGSPGNFHPCRETSIADDPKYAAATPLVVGSSNPSCGGDGAGINNASNDVQAGEYVVLSYYVDGDEFYFDTPPRYWLGEPWAAIYTDVNNPDQVMGWPGWATFLGRVQKVVPYVPLLLDWIGRRPYVEPPAHTLWQTLGLRMPWYGRLEFKVHDRRCYLRGTVTLPHHWGERAVAPLPAWLTPAPAGHEPRLRTTLVAADGSRTPAYARILNGAITVANPFGVLEGDARSMSFDGASFAVEPHDPEVP